MTLPAASQSSPSAELRWTSRDGLNLFARDYPGESGEARLPVICLHGLTRNSKDFEEIAVRISRWGRRVIVPDVRGRGQSDRDPKPGNYQPRTYARDVLDLMDRLGIARAVFLGTSMGGIITMTIAALRSKAIAGAILNDVGPSIAPEGVARILSYVGKLPEVSNWDDASAHVRRINVAALPNLSDEDWRGFARRTFREGAAGPDLDYDPAITGRLLGPPPKAAALVAGFLFRRMARRRPTLLLRGAISDVITADIATRMQRSVPALRRVDVPDVGHAPLLTEPAAVDAINQFLRTVP